MTSNNHYCPVVGTCLHEPVKIIQNSFFVIEPFDEDKEKRETAIDEGLRNYYGKENFTLITADRGKTVKGLYCDICEKIKSCQVCLADITPWTIIENKPKKGSKSFAIKENVMLELGLAYGLQTPVIIISRKINGDRYIPSDLGFIRYLDNTSDIPYETWNDLSDKLLDRMSGIKGIGFYKRRIPTNQKDLIKKIHKSIKIIYHSRKYQKEINDKKLKIQEFRMDKDGYIMAVIPKGKLIKEGMILKLMKIANGIETRVGILNVFHVQRDNLIQAYCRFDDEKDEKLLSDEIVKSNNILLAFNNRLEVYILDEYMDIPITQLEDYLHIWKTLAI